jgi:hypothetical protein
MFSPMIFLQQNYRSILLCGIYFWVFLFIPLHKESNGDSREGCPQNDISIFVEYQGSGLLQKVEGRQCPLRSGARG